MDRVVGGSVGMGMGMDMDGRRRHGARGWYAHSLLRWCVDSPSSRLAELSWLGTEVATRDRVCTTTPHQYMGG